MTKNEITLKIRQRLDEVGVNEVISLNFPIEPFIEESANQVFFDVPAHLTANIVEFLDADITANSDGSGVVKLPDEFVRLVEFKMKGWVVSLTKAENFTNALLQRQNNKMTKANPLKPVVAINGGDLCYFVVDGEHEIEIAKAQVYMKNITDYPSHLADMIAWLAASKVLQVMNESALSNNALKQYENLLKNIRG
ncbi:MAG: hypothetical protein R3Y04_05480 [Rikenellaceae bacterium]